MWRSSKATARPSWTLGIVNAQYRERLVFKY
jgi:hypothetical protein